MTEKAAGASFARYGLVLGTLAALGPLAVDMYLPGLPQLTLALEASEGAVQFSLMSFFVGLTLGQLFYGPISDKVGRRSPIQVGLALYALGSIGCALATRIEMLILFRFVQGAGSVGMVMSAAIVRDLYTGPMATRLLSKVMLVLGVSPILAPLAGSLLMASGSWRLIFVVIALGGLMAMALVAFWLPETRSLEARQAVRLSGTFRAYGRLLADGRFITTVMVPACAQAGFFAYLAASSFAFITVHHLTPFGYAVLFAANSAGLVGAAQLTTALVRRIGMRPLIFVAVIAYALAGLTLLVLTQLHIESVVALAGLLFVCVSCLGVIFPTSNVLALEPLGAIAGTASSLMGAIQFACGALASTAVGAFADGTIVPMTTIIALCGIGAFGFCSIAVARYGRG